MQAMKCEICGSNDIVKQEGIYVCQHCGTKYTVEEAKKLIGTVKIDKADEIEKALTLARRAHKNHDGEIAVKYYSSVMEDDPNNWEALFYVNYYRLCADHKITEEFGRSLDDVLSLIKSNESPDRWPELLQEIKTQVESISSTIQFEKKMNFMKSIQDDNKALFSQGGYAEIVLHTFAEAIRNNFSELSDVADEMDKRADQYKKELADTIQTEMNAKKDYQLEQMKRDQEKWKRENGGCYIATCVYGSYDCPEVWTLRRYRDNILAATWYGRAFIRIYYTVSPKLVSLFGETHWFKRFWRGKLDRMVIQLRNKGFTDNPYTDK